MITVEELGAIFGEEQLLQIAGLGPRDDRQLDRPRIEEALAHANSLIVGYVRERWPEAVAGTPLLKGFCADIARWRLRGRGGQQSAMSEVVQKRYDEAMRVLKDVAAGKLTLDVEHASGTTTANIPATPLLAVDRAMPPSRVPEILSGFRP